MKTVKHAIIQVHSFVDLITNSSSETFVSASSSTVKAIREVVDHVLKLGQSTQSFDDLFDIELVDGEYEGTRVKVTPKNSSNANAQAAAKILSNLSGLFSIEATYNG
jgi:hypothetical protein